MKTLDVTGLSCPEPVVRTIAALNGLSPGESLVVQADTATARDNIVRNANNMGYALEVETDGGKFRLTIKKP